MSGSVGFPLILPIVRLIDARADAPIALPDGFIVGDENTLTKKGKVVSKKITDQGRKNLANWHKAVKIAKKQLGITGFVAVGGRSDKGKILYAQVKAVQRWLNFDLS